MGTMINKPATPQEAAIAALQRKGWQFVNWLSAPHYDACALISKRSALMMRKSTHYRTEYCEVSPDGDVEYGEFHV